MHQPNNTKKPAQNSLINWSELMALFEQLRQLPEPMWQNFLDQHCPNDETADKLVRMLSALERTESYFDTPLTCRITSEPAWQAENWVGKRLNGFELTELLHEGNIAAVFKAAQKEPVPRNVAIKIVHPDAPPEYFDQFRLEQKALAKLTHPNIATIHTVEVTEQGLTFIVMEFINGQLLVPYCDRNGLSINQRLTLFLDVCDAISYSHQRGIQHRDIKSSNILVRELDSGHIPVIIDFGISVHAGGGNSTQEVALRGTPEYMSPELFDGSVTTDIRADVYSLGMVLFNLLVGKIPFDRERFLELEPSERAAMLISSRACPPSQAYAALNPSDRVNIADKRSASARQYRKLLSEDLDWIYRKATHSQSEQRYQSVSELANSIKRYLNNEVVRTEGAPWWYRIKKFTQRHFIASTAITAVTIMMIAFVATVMLQNKQILAEIERAEREKKIAIQITELTSNIFNSASPWTQKGDSAVSIEALLDKGQQDILTNTGLSGHVKYALLLTLVKTYLGMGLTEPAQKINDLILYRTDYADPVTDIKANLNGSRLAHFASEREQQLSFAKHAYSLCETHSITGKVLAQTLTLLGSSYYDLGQFSPAKEAHEKSLEALHDLPEIDRALEADVILNLANVTYWLNDYKKAEQLYDDALRINTSLYSDEHPSVLKNRIHLAELWRVTGRHNQAIETLSTALSAQKKIWGENNFDVLTTQGELIRAYRYAQQYSRAEALNLDLLAKLKQSVGELDEQYINFTINLGLIYLAQEKHGEAVAILQKTYDLVKSNDKSMENYTEPMIGYASFDLAQALVFDDKTHIAIKYIEESVEYFQTSPANNKFYLAEALTLQALIRIDLDEFVTAEKDAHMAVSIFSLMLGKDHYRTTLATAVAAYANIRQNWVQQNYVALKTHLNSLIASNNFMPAEIKRFEHWLTLLNNQFLDHQ